MSFHNAKVVAPLKVRALRVRLGASRKFPQRKSCGSIEGMLLQYHHYGLLEFPQRKSCGSIEGIPVCDNSMMLSIGFHNAKVVAPLKGRPCLQKLHHYSSFHNAKVVAPLKESPLYLILIHLRGFHNAKVVAPLKATDVAGIGGKI